MVYVTTSYSMDARPADFLAATPATGWYVARLMTGAETRALAQLRCRLPDAGYVVLWQTTTRCYSRQRQRRHSRLFLPGYLFIQGTHFGRGDLFEVLRPVLALEEMPGDGTFAAELNSFCRMVLAAGDDLQRRPGYSCGDMVEVVEGALTGCRGRIVRRCDAYELEVGLSMLGTIVSSRIDIACVQPVGVG